MAKIDNWVKDNKELTLLIMTWAVLIFYLLLKLIFGYYVGAAQNDVWFKTVCNYIDNNAIITYVLSCTVNYIMFSIYYRALLNKPKLDNKEKIILLITDLSTNTLCGLNIYLDLLIDITKAFIIPLLFLNKFNARNLILCLVFVTIHALFMGISLFVRNLTLSNIQENSCLAMVLSFDVVIMMSILRQWRLIRKRKGELKCYS